MLFPGYLPGFDFGSAAFNEINDVSISNGNNRLILLLGRIGLKNKVLLYK